MTARPRKVRLVSNQPRTRKAVKEALAPIGVLARHASSQPKAADAVVTTGRLTSGVEYMAAALGVPYVFVLPEAAAFLDEWLARTAPRHGDLHVLVGHDVGDPEQLAKVDPRADHEEVEL